MRQPKRQTERKSKSRVTNLRLYQKSKISNPKPWLDDTSFPLSDEQLRIVSFAWTPEIWEEYLKSLEGRRREDLGVRKDRRLLLDDFEHSEGGQEASFRDLIQYEPEQRERTRSVTSVVAEPKVQGEAEPTEVVIPEDEKGQLLVHHSLDGRIEEEFDLQHEVETAMEVLTVNEGLVIHHIYWEGRSEWKIACLFRRARWTIRTWRDRALVKLRPVLSPVFRKYERARFLESENIPGYYLMIQ